MKYDYKFKTVLIGDEGTGKKIIKKELRAKDQFPIIVVGNKISAFKEKT